MITNVKPPVWDKNNREWILDYVVNDPDIGIYTQRIRTEALISAHRCIKMIKEKLK